MKTAVNLSNYQYKMLLEMIANGGVSVEEAGGYKQVTLGSFIRREYLELKRKEKMLIPTRKAIEARDAFREADIRRRIQSSTLSVFFYKKNGLSYPKNGGGGGAHY
jgi:hypothetical protein